MWGIVVIVWGLCSIEFCFDCCWWSLFWFVGILWKGIWFWIFSGIWSCRSSFFWCSCLGVGWRVVILWGSCVCCWGICSVVGSLYIVFSFYRGVRVIMIIWLCFLVIDICGFMYRLLFGCLRIFYGFGWVCKLIYF